MTWIFGISGPGQSDRVEWLQAVEADVRSAGRRSTSSPRRNPIAAVYRLIVQPPVTPMATETKTEIIYDIFC